ncbi:hypothetical protein [Rhodoferax fermentans]|uniref:hypothetical protein n=1 Tax=Rhodoferax fermentans TaxID=28066 RepID=UPI001301C7A1|nr:hypothetical protein [Rhodoferax fermentans]
MELLQALALGITVQLVGAATAQPQDDYTGFADESIDAGEHFAGALLPILMAVVAFTGL